jgi:hypothetical protein
MLRIVGTVADSILQIAKGNIEKAAGFVEKALAGALPVAIAFLANQVGLGGLADRLKEMIKKVQAKVNQALDWLIDKALKLGKSIFNAFKAGVKSVGNRLKNWWKAFASRVVPAPPRITDPNCGFRPFSQGSETCGCGKNSISGKSRALRGFFLFSGPLRPPAPFPPHPLWRYLSVAFSIENRDLRCPLAT